MKLYTLALLVRCKERFCLKVKKNKHTSITKIKIMPKALNVKSKRIPGKCGLLLEVTVLLDRKRTMSLENALAKLGPPICIDCAMWIKEYVQNKEELRRLLCKQMDYCINKMPWKAITVRILSIYRKEQQVTSQLIINIVYYIESFFNSNSNAMVCHSKGSKFNFKR